MTVTPSQMLRKNITARPLESPEVKPTPKNKGGRPSRKNTEAGVQAILDAGAPYAACLLRDHVRKKRGVKSLKPSMQRAAEYIIDHAIGKARQKIEHSGGILTYAELAKSAGDLDTKPRDILADVEEIAKKHQPGETGVNTEPPAEVKAEELTESP